MNKIDKIFIYYNYTAKVNKFPTLFATPNSNKTKKHILYIFVPLPVLSWFLYQKLTPKSIIYYAYSHGFSPMAINNKTHSGFMEISIVKRYILRAF